MNGDTTVKTLGGLDIKDTDATNAAKNPTLKITFLNGEEVIIANSAPSNYNITGGSTTISTTTPSIWYSSETVADSSRVEKWGVAQGYTFEGYQRSN